jgi:hypothetical protein
MTPPTMIVSRRSRARELNRRSADIRTRRAHLKRGLQALPPATGATLVKGILLKPPTWAQTMSVETLIRAINGFGPERTRKILTATQARASIASLEGPECVRLAAACERDAAHMHKRRCAAPVDHRQAAEALRRAQHVRLTRAHTLAEIAQAPDTRGGAVRAVALIATTTRPSELEDLRVRSVLEAIPGISINRANKLMDSLALGETATLRVLSSPRANALTRVLLAHCCAPASR